MDFSQFHLVLYGVQKPICDVTLSSTILCLALQAFYSFVSYGLGR